MLRYHVAVNLNNLFKLLMLGKLLRGGGGFGGGGSPGRPSRGKLVMILIIGGFIFWQYMQKQKAARPTRETDSRQTDARSPQNDRPTPTRPPAVQINPGRLDPVPSNTPVENPGRLGNPSATPSISGDGGIGKLYQNKQSNVIVTAGGTIAKILPDDNDTTDGSSRHQRFLVRLASGDTVLIAHNIDLTAPIPAKEGDVITFKGEYEWTDRGGVVHWTHRDARGRHEDGWIEHAGKRYE